MMAAMEFHSRQKVRHALGLDIPNLDPEVIGFPLSRDLI